jgi:hypothetical protein
MAERAPFALKLMPSFLDMAVLAPVAFLFGRMDGVKTLLSDCDTGWHIRTGQWIAAHHAVPMQDIFSFSKPGNPWFAWEWLCDVLFGFLNAVGGLQAVAFLSILLLCATFGLLYRITRSKSNALIAICVTSLALPVASIHWLARPHLFTMLFAVLFYGALESVRNGRTRFAGVPYLAILPAATALWTNLHGGFFVGPLLVLAYGAAELLTWMTAAEPTRRAAARTAARGYLLSGAACLAASLLNPYTYHLHAHMVEFLRDPRASRQIAEYFSPTFHHPLAIFLEVMLGLSAVAACWHFSKGRLTEPILLAIWAHASMLAVRNMPIFAIVAAPAIASAMEEWLAGSREWKAAEWMRQAAGKFHRMASDVAAKEAVGRWHLVPALGLALVAAVIWAPHPPKKFRAEFDPEVYPAGAVAALRADVDAHIFTNDEWGDYLIWTLYPGNRVFVDGRIDFYGDEFEQNYVDVMNVKNGWEKTLAGFGVDTILLPPDAPLSGALKESSRWRVVYDDGISLVFRASAKEWGRTVSVTTRRGGESRDREITKTGKGDPTITSLRQPRS